MDREIAVAFILAVLKDCAMHSITTGANEDGEAVKDRLHALRQWFRTPCGEGVAHKHHSYSMFNLDDNVSHLLVVDRCRLSSSSWFIRSSSDFKSGYCDKRRWCSYGERPMHTGSVMNNTANINKRCMSEGV